MSTPSNPAIEPSRTRKIQIEVREIAQQPSRKSAIAPLNVDADGSDASN